MAATPLFTNENVMALLKTVYKDGIESDIYRNSPVLPTIEKLKVDGKEFRWAATYAAAPTASPDYLISQAMATKQGQNVEFIATKARHFATLTISQKEIKASRTGKGAYGRVLGNKVFQALEGMRKQMARFLYGQGYGELGTYTGATVTPASGAVVTLPEYATIALFPQSQFRLMKNGNPATIVPAVGAQPYVVGTVDDTQITLDASTGTTGQIESGDVLIVDGAVDASGVFHCPHGLGYWVLNRNAANYSALLSDMTMGVNRSRAPSALGGQFYAAVSGEKVFDAILKLLRKCRRAGGDPNLVILNDIAAIQAISEYETLRTQFLYPDTKRAGTFRGANSASFVLWSSVLDKLVDDPYCTQNLGYVLTKEDLCVLHMDNIDRVVSDNAGPGEAPGRSDPLADDGADYGETGDKLMIDDLVSIEDGQATSDGAVKLVGFNLFYEYVLWNTASSGVVDLSAILV
jgi:hypothetical protein